MLQMLLKGVLADSLEELHCLLPPLFKSINKLEAYKQAGSLRVAAHLTTLVNASRIPEVQVCPSVTPMIYFSCSLRVLLKYPAR